MSRIIQVFGGPTPEMAHAVMVDTWGHLAPEPGRRYEGHITFAQDEGGREIFVIKSEFEGLPGSPWYHEDENLYIERLFDLPALQGYVGVFRFDGIYRRRDLERPGKFTGKITLVECQV